MSRIKHDPRYDLRLKQVGDRLRAIRERNGLSQDEISELIKVSRRQWISWERGEVTLSAWAILELMEFLDVDPAWLLSGPEVEPRELSNSNHQTRFGRIKATVSGYARNLGLGLPPTAVPRLAILVMKKPEEAEKATLKDVREMLRGLALGRSVSGGDQL